MEMNTIDKIGDDAICDGLITRSITELVDDLVTDVGDYCFYECTSLTRVVLRSVKTCGGQAFGKCSNLTSVELPLLEKITSGGAFQEAGLTEAYFPALTNTYMSVFFRCPSLKKIKMPAATSVNKLAQYCDKLEEADFTALTQISANSFANCKAFSTLILRGETKICALANTNAFSYTAINGSAGRIYAPRALLSDTDSAKDYRRATNWSTFAAKFRALEDYTVDGTVTGDLDPTKI